MVKPADPLLAGRRESLDAVGRASITEGLQNIVRLSL
jgi:hypothetical protein